MARAAGYTGSARTFRRAVAAQKAVWRNHRRVYRPWVPEPGQHLLIDYGTVTQGPNAGLQLFTAVLAGRGGVPADGFGGDLTMADTAAVAWCGEVNAAIHSEIAAVPHERLTVERAGAVRLADVEAARVSLPARLVAGDLVSRRAGGVLRLNDAFIIDPRSLLPPPGLTREDAVATAARADQNIASPKVGDMQEIAGVATAAACSGVQRNGGRPPQRGTHRPVG